MLAVVSRVKMVVAHYSQMWRSEESCVFFEILWLAHVGLSEVLSWTKAGIRYKSKPLSAGDSHGCLPSEQPTPPSPRPSPSQAHSPHVV